MVSKGWGQRDSNSFWFFILEECNCESSSFIIADQHTSQQSGCGPNRTQLGDFCYTGEQCGKNAYCIARRCQCLVTGGIGISDQPMRNGIDCITSFSTTSECATDLDCAKYNPELICQQQSDGAKFCDCPVGSYRNISYTPVGVSYYRCTTGTTDRGTILLCFLAGGVLLNVWIIVEKISRDRQNRRVAHEFAKRWYMRRHRKIITTTNDKTMPIFTLKPPK